MIQSNQGSARSALVLRLLVAIGMLSLSTACYGQDMIGLRLTTTDVSGEAIDKVEQGEQFMLKAYVDDLRDGGEGVFAAYVDIAFDSELATLDGDNLVAYDPFFDNGSREQLDAGMLNDVGGFAASLTPPGPDEQLLFELPLVATKTGLLEFVPSEAGDPPFTDFLLYGLDDRIANVALTSASINIVPEPATGGAFLLSWVMLGFWSRLRATIK